MEIALNLPKTLRLYEFFLVLAATPLETLGWGRGEVDFIFTKKKLCWRVVLPSLKIVINFPFTCETIHFKKELYMFSG